MILSSTNPALLIFSDDWGRHPSSCQHLAKVLRERYRIWWVNTIGTRRPRLDLSTLRRTLEKAGQWSRPADPIGKRSNPEVLNPRMWPYFRTSLDRRLNRELLRRQVAPMVQSAAGPVVAITTIPVVADLIGRIPVTHWIYYCVDDFEEWPGLDRQAIRPLEASMVRRADGLITVSETIRDRFAAMGRESSLLTHGTDLNHWTSGEGEAEFSFAQNWEKPWVVFWGLIDQRLDVGFLQRLGTDLDRGTILLVGPELNADAALARVPRLVRPGSLTYDQLPALARAAEVLVMPYDDLPVTRAMQPLKLKEYLATGKPVVVRDLPATRSWADALDLATTPGAFSDAVRRRIREGISPEQKAARLRLEFESWVAKAAEFERLALGKTLRHSMGVT